MPDSRVLTRVRHLLERDQISSRDRPVPEVNETRSQEVYRLYRLYAAVSRELGEAATRPEMVVRAERRDGGLLLTIADPRVNYRRQSLAPPPLDAYFIRLLERLGLPGPA
ncbi:MAG: hypothetical protein LDL11_08620 [Desulfarculus sp.]|nr:hypothetical protein [Desulfarculus sp.]